MYLKTIGIHHRGAEGTKVGIVQGWPKGDGERRLTPPAASVEPELLGGLVVQVDDWVYDASVRTRLDILRKQLVERSSHAIQSGRDRFSSW